MSEIALQCQCGQFRGMIENFSVAGSGRAVCYCDDCQAYAHALGRGSEALDQWGGTDITPVMPKQFKILKGELSLLRLSKDGLFRWYAPCCNSPVANAPNATLPYLGLVTSVTALEPSERDRQLGRVHFRMQTRYAIGQPPPPRSESIGFAAMKWMTVFLAKAFFKGGAKPTPFFHQNGEPSKPARVLSREERDQLRQFCGPKP